MGFSQSFAVKKGRQVLSSEGNFSRSARAPLAEPTAGGDSSKQSDWSECEPFYLQAQADREVQPAM